ncbi:MAG: chemotaxis protein CheX [Lentisphaerales bacterium]|nr:chemotaxis protein CheX [Lentisphaerales bacterium]
MSHESCRRMLAQHNLTANSNDFEILMRSTVGEVSNTLAGEFLALPQVRQTFGHVEVHPPIILDDHVKDNPAFPLVQGYCGKIQFDEIEILTFISDNFSSLQESDQYSA